MRETVHTFTILPKPLGDVKQPSSNCRNISHTTHTTGELWVALPFHTKVATLKAPGGETVPPRRDMRRYGSFRRRGFFFFPTLFVAPEVGQAVSDAIGTRRHLRLPANTNCPSFEFVGRTGTSTALAFGVLLSCGGIRRQAQPDLQLCDQADVISNRKKRGVQFHPPATRIATYPGTVQRMRLANGWKLDQAEIDFLMGWFWSSFVPPITLTPAPLQSLQDSKDPSVAPTLLASRPHANGWRQVSISTHAPSTMTGGTGRPGGRNRCKRNVSSAAAG